MSIVCAQTHISDTDSAAVRLTQNWTERAHEKGGGVRKRKAEGREEIEEGEVS